MPTEIDARNDEFTFLVHTARGDVTIDALEFSGALSRRSDAEVPTVVAVVRETARPADVAGSLTDNEAFAVGARIARRLESLGKG